jgi:hypothetical protein
MRERSIAVSSISLKHQSRPTSLSVVAHGLKPANSKFTSVRRSRMSRCYKSGDFKKYFDENMKELGLPVPSTLFGTYQTAVATASTLVGTLKTLGKGATMGELIGATTGLEELAVAASIGAAAYTGAVIGSIAVASGRSLGCGSRISDMFVFIHKNGLQFNGWHAFYAHNSQIFDKGHRLRNSFGLRAKSSPASFEYA